MNSRRKKKISKGTVVRIVIVLVLIAAAGTAAVKLLQKKVTEEYGAETVSDIKEAKVTRGSVSTSVYGDGTLTDEDVEEVEIPEGVGIVSLAVAAGDSVREGDLLASVSSSSVISAMHDLQNQIDELDESLEEAADDAVDSSLTTKVSGRVKAVFAEAGDDVVTVMTEHNALALLSLDGCMKAEIETDALEEGDEVSVEEEDGTVRTGTVSECIAGKAVVLVTDAGTVYGETVKVSGSDGNLIGTGTLEINDPLSILGYGGTVESVSVSSGSSVSAGDELFELTDTSYTANYESLLSEREELTAQMQTLAEILKNDAVYAPLSGTVKSVPDTEETSEAETEDDGSVFSISPDENMTISVSIDETDILQVAVGQSAAVTIDSLGNRTYEGAITAIDKSGTSSSGVTEYTVTVQVPKEEGMLSGMSASAVITIESAEDVLLIPTDALNKTRDTYYVYTEKDTESGEPGGMAEVTVGVSGSEYTEIKEGLEEGSTVYYTETETENNGGFQNGGMPGGGQGFGGGMPGGDGNMPGGGSSRGGISSGGGQNRGGSDGNGRSGRPDGGGEAGRP